MSIYLILFYVFAAATLVAAIGVVTAKNVVHCAFLLVFSFLGVAGLYVLLMADFLALVQVLIYTGAVTTLLLFGLMLTRLKENPLSLDNPQKPLAIVAGLAFLGMLLLAVYGTNWPAPPSSGLRRVAFSDLGRSLFDQWVIPFEIVSLVLLVALLGALIIARAEEKE